MQSRLHLVAKCENSNSTCEGNCGQCIDRKSLKSIYENQLSLLISLDEDDNFQPRLDFFNGCTEESVYVLLNALKKGTVSDSKYVNVAKAAKKTVPTSNVVETESSNALVRKGTRNRTETQYFSVKTAKPAIKSRTCTSESIQVQEDDDEYDLKNVTPSNKSFFEPLIHFCIPLAGNLMISKSLWADKCVSLNKIGVGNKLIDFKPDGFVHRQFCVSTRGWDVFSHLLVNFESSVKIANEIMASQVLFENDLNRENSDLIRKVIYDTAPSFFEYSEELRGARNQESYLDQLEIQAKLQKNIVKLQPNINLPPFATEKEQNINISSMISAQIEAVKSQKYPANIGKNLLEFSDEESKEINSESAASSSKSQQAEENEENIIIAKMEKLILKKKKKKKKN